MYRALRTMYNYRMPNPVYSVETRSSGCLLVAHPSPLVDAVAKILTQHSLSPLVISPHPGHNSAELKTYLSTYDLDYLLIFSPPSASFFAQLPGEGSYTTLSLNHAVSSAPRQLVLGEYLSPGNCPTLDDFLQEALEQGSITLPEGGLLDYGLLTITSLAQAICQSLLAPRFPSSELILTNPSPTSLLSLAQSLLPLLPRPAKIIFAEKNLSLPTHDYPSLIKTYSTLNLALEPDISSALSSYVKQFTHAKPASSPSIPPQPSASLPPSPVLPKPITPRPTLSNLEFVPVAASLIPRARRLSLPSHRKIILRGIIIALALYLGTFAFTLTMVGLHLRTISSSFASGSLPSLTVSPLVSASATYLEANLVTLGLLPPFSQISSYQDLLTLTSAYTHSLTVLKSASTLTDSATSLANYILGSDNGDPVALISSTRLQSETLYQQLALLDGMLPPDPPPLLTSRQESYQSLKSGLFTAKKALLTTKAALASLPELIALGKRAKYLVLFQNNMELRATGGFIGSFAILSFENGRLYDFPIYDVYQADGQLKGHVEPPLPIKNILGEANWYLRDSNFDPDFPTSARRAEWFLNKTLNQEVAGTIGLTLDAMRSLLQLTGPLKLADYQETIGEGNVYERAQYHAEVNFFPGSTAKKEFLSSVGDAIFTALREPARVNSLQLLSTLSILLESKNLQLSLSLPELDRVWQTLNWNGAIQPASCPSDVSCVSDYAFLVDSNFGVNKSNYYLSRQLFLDIEITKEQTINHTFRAVYQNTATSTAWPAGIYKNYLRLYLPKGAQIYTVTLGDKTYTSKDYTVTQEHGKLVLGLLAAIPVNSSLTFTATYTTPGHPESNSLYTWYWQKQAGTPVTEHLAVTLNYPLYLTPTTLSPAPASNEAQQLQFNLFNDSDHRLSIKF